MGVSQVSAGKVIVSHPVGNANVAAVVTALYEEELLEAYYTSVLWRPEHPLARLLPSPVRVAFERRARLQLPSRFVRLRPFREVMRQALARTGRRYLTGKESSPFSIDAVYRVVDRAVERDIPKLKGLRALYAYEYVALNQFRKAHQFGVHCIYDLPIGYWRANRVMSNEEAELQPAWKGTLSFLADSEAKCAIKDRELELADTVIVPSTFVKNTLDMYPGAKKKIVVNPFGTPGNIASPRELTDRDSPLRVLYVGSLSQRKGISYLFEAINKAGSAVTLTVIGRKVGQSDLLDKYCAKHRWIPTLPHSEILAEMRNHDVFVFPSLFEGLALVQGEAISQGLPVITTPNSGGADILRDGVDGFIVPIREPEAIAARLMELYQDRELLQQMSNSALEQAAQLDWPSYQARVIDVVRQAIG
jgi:glycosyltransferase involved in cell wall biosynthesis